MEVSVDTGGGGPGGIFEPGGGEVGLDAGHDVGVIVGNVFGLSGITQQIVQTHRSRGFGRADEFPASQIEDGLGESALIEFPVEKIVGGLISRAALQGRGKAY
jgi:hypothetical protein